MKVAISIPIRRGTGFTLHPSYQLQQFEQRVCEKCLVNVRSKCKTAPQQGRLLTNHVTGDQRMVWACDSYEPTTAVKLLQAKKILQQTTQRTDG